MGCKRHFGSRQAQGPFWGPGCGPPDCAKLKKNGFYKTMSKRYVKTKKHVFIGLGKEDLVQHGDTLPLLELGHQVGVVRVKQILGPHLSRAIVVDCSQPLKAGLVIGQRLVPGQSRN